MKLKRYLKPYLGCCCCAAIVLLFGQAMPWSLTLPNLMSDIVNVGIQQGGITEAAPKAVSAEGLQLMSAFMSEEDRALAQSQYVLAEQANMTADEWDRFVTDWPRYLTPMYTDRFRIWTTARKLNWTARSAVRPMR